MNNLTESAGEWTYEYVQNFYRGHTHSVDGLRAIMTAHNAALAAEREVGGNTAIALAQQITKLEEQLAAEREKCKQAEWERDSVLRQSNAALAAEREKLESVIDEEIAKNNQLRKQLDAEREKREHAESLVLRGDFHGTQEVQQLREQLAAEREKYAEQIGTLVNQRSERDLAIKQLNEQLAAEREVGHNQAVTLGQHIARLEDQLAAEREKHAEQIGTLINQRSERDLEIKQLREQLAAERKANRGLYIESNERKQALDAAIEALKEVERLAKGNITGCGTCHSILESIMKVRQNDLNHPQFGLQIGTFT